MMHDNLPDEILFRVFRTLSVSRYTEHIVAAVTSNRVGRVHAKADWQAPGERDRSHWVLLFPERCSRWPSVEYGPRLLRTTTNTQRSGHDYVLCAKYSEVRHLQARWFASDLVRRVRVHVTDGFTYVDHLTTLVLHGIQFGSQTGTRSPNCAPRSPTCRTQGRIRA